MRAAGIEEHAPKRCHMTAMNMKKMLKGLKEHKRSKHHEGVLLCQTDHLNIEQ